MRPAIKNGERVGRIRQCGQGLVLAATGGVWLVSMACSQAEEGGLAASSAASQTATGRSKQEGTAMTWKAKGSSRWFPGDPAELESMVKGYIEKASVSKIDGRIVGVISPHAGYIYSGKVAGHAFRAVKDNAAAGHKPDCVVIVGFSHSMGFRGVALMEGDGLRTPLGVASLDEEVGAMLTNASSRIVFNYSRHGTEHSAENQIPFVQTALPGVKMVVGLIGDHDSDTVDELAKALGVVAQKKRLLVVASTDLLHHADYDRVTNTDKVTLQKIVDLDRPGLMKLYRDEQVCCGITAVLTVMQFAEAQGCKKGTWLCYRNSGDDHPDSRGNYVVGYGVVAFAVP